MAAVSWTLLPDTLLHRALHGLTSTDAPSPDAYDAVLEEAREAFAAALEGESGFALLVARAGLERPDAEVFAALCAVELDPARQRAIAQLADDPAQQRLSLALLSALFGPDHPGPLVVSPDSALARSALVELSAAPTWSTRLASPAERVVWFLAGDDSLDPRLPLDVDVVFGPGNEETDDERDTLLLVVGADATRRLQAAVDHLPGRAFLVADAPPEPSAWAALVREATVSDAGIVIGVRDALGLDARWWIERTPHLAWAVSSPSELPLEGLPRRPWREVLAADAHADPEEVRDVFGAGVEGQGDLNSRRLTAQQLTNVRRAADGVGGARAALRRLAAGPIEKLARRIRPRIGWDDLILPPDHLAQLRELTARYRHRGVVHGEWGANEFPSPGVVVLFAGASGTGKTTAAEVVAADLGVDLFKIEVASVVSKYIGETEKNLEELFAAAQSGDLVLCFDEADAILGKRSEVVDARDRYANLEVSYLLQRLETYEGFVVLTTNLQSNIDDAFLRRLHARISFPNPGPHERRLIWERSLIGVPTKDLDLESVAHRFDLVGGSIRNAAMNGAFLAAAVGTPLTMDLLLLGLKREYQKHGRLVTKELFGDWYELIAPSS